MITCKRCGKDNQDHYKFCLGCGSELSAAGGADAGGGVGTMRTVMPNSPGQRPPTPPSGVPPQSAQPPQGAPPQGAPPQGPPPGGAPGAPPQGGPPPGAGAPPPGQPPGGAPPPGPPQGGPPPAQPPPGGGGGPLPGVPSGAPPAGPPQGAPPPGAPQGAPPPGAPQGAPPQGVPPGAGQPPAGVVCPSCGTQIPQGFKFCGACGTKLDDAPPPAAQPPSAPAAQAAPAPQVQGALTLIRPDGSEGGTHTLAEGENTVGRDYGELFEADGYLSPAHADIVLSASGALIRDRDSLNGVFVRMTEEEELGDGQIIRVGQELLRFNLLDAPEPMKDGTEVMGSPNPGYWGKITVVIGDGIDGSAFPLLGDSVTIGRERGDINFPEDGYVSGLHAKLGMRDGRPFLEDLGSSNGTFLKIDGERELREDSFVLLGQQLFRVSLQGP